MGDRWNCLGIVSSGGLFESRYQRIQSVSQSVL